MPAGAIIYNDHGSVLLDQTYANLAIRQQGTLTFSTAQVKTVSLSSASVPVAAVRCTGYAAVVALNGTTLYIYGAAGTTVYWYVFDKPVPGAGGYGFQVFDAAGNCTFDALQKYARVVDIFTGLTTKAYPSGNSYAVATLKPARQRQISTRDAGLGSVYVDETFNASAAKVNGGTIQTALQPVLSSTGELPMDPGSVPSGWSDPTCQFAVIDVTNY